VQRVQLAAPSLGRPHEDDDVVVVVSGKLISYRPSRRRAVAPGVGPPSVACARNHCPQPAAHRPTPSLPYLIPLPLYHSTLRVHLEPRWSVHAKHRELVQGVRFIWTRRHANSLLELHFFIPGTASLTPCNGVVAWAVFTRSSSRLSTTSRAKHASGAFPISYPQFFTTYNAPFSQDFSMANARADYVSGTAPADSELRRRNVPATGSNGSALSPREVDDKKSRKVAH
jgi:hypothetical protein